MARSSTIERWLRVPLLLVPVALWIWLCRDWPTRLGFCSDDWMVLLHPFVGTAEAFRDTLRLVATRPVSAPYIWLAQVITDWSPVRAQFLNAAMLLIASASVGLLAGALITAVRNLRTGASVGASVAAATFIVFPSTIGTFAWGVGVTTAIPALPLFCLATSLLLHSGNSRWRLGAGLVLALLSHLSYEAFYFQEIVFLLLAATLRGSTIKEMPWRAVAGTVLINVACLAFNRLIPGGVQKSFHWDFIHIFIGGYSHILAILGHAAREHKFLIAGTVIVAGPSGAICLARLVGASRMGLAFLLVVGGIVASGLLYASAGYGLASEGPMARVSIVIATYYAIVAGVLAAAACCMPGGSRLPAVTFCFSAAIGLIALELTARARTGEWAETWSYELARLSRLPAAVTSGNIPAGGDQRIYVALEDGPPLSLAAATAPWEIAGAVAWASYKMTNNRLLTIDLWKGSRTLPRWFAASHGWFNRWDGQRFEQGFCHGAVIYSAAGRELWSWNSSTGDLRKVDTIWEHGCN
ncbi:hypothetical protein [Bradyrhizobium sp.]|uniref:hypothetical protein n=1 Tax=Bradyrhizobium sp. TaxID=376 RepID=UPI0026254F9B|nr:hypothetical protein [Bradyrhizobium sp.]